jgi:2-amino-4-hydroxy-6-hydroxymethyldihydropteridine diphosphokinase
VIIENGLWLKRIVILYIDIENIFTSIKARTCGNIAKFSYWIIQLMQLVALGSNLPHPEYGSPRSVLARVIAVLPDYGIEMVRQSRWYATKPVPVSDQPDFVNSVISVRFSGDAPALLSQLHAIEEHFGRVRSVLNAARIIDLDLLAFDNQCVAGIPGSLTIPHPRLHERRFVLQPLCDIAPDWQHPVLLQTAAKLLQGLPSSDQGDTVALSE